MGPHIRDTTDAWISVYNFHWRKNIWFKTRKWNISSYIYKYNIVFTCIVWKDSCTGISRWELCWASDNHIIIPFLSSWDCLCPSKQVLICQDTYGIPLKLLIAYLRSLGWFQEAERKIPLNYASRYSSRSGGLQRSAYLPFKVCCASI